jgi:ParB family transcriptional regulator, chromosome partitioning protein
LLADPSDDLGVLQSLAQNIARRTAEPGGTMARNKKRVALGGTEEWLSLALPSRQIGTLRLLANILPANVARIARGDMPNNSSCA